VSARRRLDIGFLHLELGLGGAERVVLDAARHLQEVGHRVTMFTARAGPHSEQMGDGSLDIRVHGRFLPSHVGRRARAACAITRMAYLTGALLLSRQRFDVIVCDLLAHTLPVLNRLSRARIVFYCHFPDQLQASRAHWLSRVYRSPIDRLEAVGTGRADRVLVNSQFTATAFRRTFPRLHAKPVEVLYPGVDITDHEPPCGGPNARAGSAREVLLLSINRYEPRKNLGLAVEAVALLRERLPADVFRSVRLVIAGTYDDRWREQRETFQSLEALIRRRGLGDRVELQRSGSETERLALLARCRCVVYTPAEEHFGLGVLEAMAAGRPVVAVASGGPLETVQHDRTGLLCEPTPSGFADALARLVSEPATAERMGRAGRLRAAANFSRAAFGARLEAIVQELASAAS